MAKVLFCILVTFCVAHIIAQRISELNCFEYSKIPLIAAKPAPHMAVWILQDDDNEIFANDAALISPTFLISAASFYLFLIRSKSSRVYFAIDDWYNVNKIMNRFGISLILLKIARIRLDSYHRPSCLWTRGNIELESVDIFRSHITDMNCDRPIKLATPLNKNHMELSVTSINITDVAYDRPKLYHQFIKCTEISNVYTFIELIQIPNPPHDLPDIYYIYGAIHTISPGRCELRSNSDRCSIEGYDFKGDTLDWIESQVWNNNSIDFNSGIHSIDFKCGTIDNNVRPMILNSMPTLPKEFPWHAAIYHIQNETNKIYACGGTLINEQTVITAAHCVATPYGMKKEPQTLLVVLGKHDLLQTTHYSRECRVINVSIHHRYDHETFENDVALLKLEIMIEYSPYIKPICITSIKKLFKNLTGVIPGWGLNEDGQEPKVLQKASFSIRTKRKCRKAGRHISGITAFFHGSNFCAGMANGTNLCDGDSGGGLVYNINNQWFLRGIASVGVLDPDTGKCDPFGFSLFTDVVKIQNWIQNNL